jgi:hypothetical protein
MEPDIEAQRNSAEDGGTASETPKSCVADESEHGERTTAKCRAEGTAANTHQEGNEGLLPVDNGTPRHDSIATPSIESSESRVPSSYSAEVDEDTALFAFAEELRDESPPGEPWYMEMTRLRRIQFLYLNRQLAQCRKRILERQEVTEEEMVTLKGLLRDQGRPPWHFVCRIANC